ncbi:MAG: type IV pilus twitching motility protein PilT [Gemmatimonadaceae bacterium]
MPQLDKFLSALVSNGASALHLAADDVAKLEIASVAHPVTKQALTATQLLALLREVAPSDAMRQVESGQQASFAYVAGGSSFVARAGTDGGRLRVAIAPAPSANGANRTNGARSSGAHPVPANGNGNGSGTGAAANGHGAAAPTAPRTSRPPVVVDEVARGEIEALLRKLVERGASDLHLRVGEPPILRTHGEMARLEGAAPLTNDHLERMLLSIMPERNRKEFAEVNDTDFAHEIEACARFRSNVLRDRKGVAAVFRVIPAAVVTVEQLGISPEVQRLCYLTKGLVLVTGPTGSGKSTTLCSLIDLVNRMRTDHIITIEDPIEFVHPNKRCVITQRQVGVHTASFKQALRAALREDPDIILVGELRDLETVSIAIETAETGHLVFGTLHTTTAASTLDRLIDQFPSDRQEQIRVMLSESLKGVISQTLCKKIGGGRVAAREILLTTPAISNLIREGKTFQIPSIMQTSKKLGMVTLTDALMDLVNQRLVEPKEAYFKAIDKLTVANGLKQAGHDTSFLDIEAAAAAADAGNGRPTPSAGSMAARRSGAVAGR